MKASGDRRCSPDAARQGSIYCPACFGRIPHDAQTCPLCGASLARMSARDYKEKLLAALAHPLAEVRMRAIIALGERGEPDAAAALIACALGHPADVVEGLEIVRSLARIDSGQPCLAALRKLVRSHPSRPVRSAASRALADDRRPPGRARGEGPEVESE